MIVGMSLLMAAAGSIAGSSVEASLPPRLELPVICSLPTECLVQKLMDIDPTPQRVDYRCGLLTTDGHDGIDIRLRTLADMRKGIGVAAAADGKVLRIRDGEPDVSVTERGDLDGRDAGNGIVIDHGNGWETQYSHLRQGSVLVRPGAKVRAGDKIGSIGMSGNAEFPHVHFTVRHNGRAIDPFTGLAPPTTCNAERQGQTLWSPLAVQTLTYRPTAILAVGFASAPPPTSLAARQPDHTAIKTSEPLILWADVLGAMPGDTQHFEIRGSDGKVLFERTSTIERGGLSWLAYAGRKPPAGGWPTGTVTGRYQLKRMGTVVDAREGQVTIR